MRSKSPWPLSPAVTVYAAPARFPEVDQPAYAIYLIPSPAPELPACLACGTCCFSRLDTFVRVSGDDYARLAERADSLVRFDGNRAYMRMSDGHCSALVIDPHSEQFVCGVYATRPQLCRELARGSGACLAERDAKADRPLQARNRAKV
jgi:Fe-S-cluster containining protein